MYSCDDESSRDSGICDMEEGASTNFSGLLSGDTVEGCVDKEIEELVEDQSLMSVEEVAVSQIRFSASFGVSHFEAYQLKTLPKITSTAYRRISVETLVEVMQSMSQIEFKNKFMLIDCRYPYEYQGGHIINAINICDREEVHGFFFENQQKEAKMKIPIFYCEYSQKRGPAMANALRQADRERNVSIYPNCSYEEMYVLDQGYKYFYEYTKAKKLNQFCQPSDYVAMDHEDHSDELKKYTYHKKANQSRTIIRHTSLEICASNVSSSSVRRFNSSPELKEVRVSKQTVSKVTMNSSTVTSGGLRFRQTNQRPHQLFHSPTRVSDVQPITHFELSP